MTEDEAISHVEALLATSYAFRARMLALLVRSGLYRGNRSHEVMQRAVVAAGMLDAGSQRNLAQAMLRERYGISRATAYRTLDKALEIRQGTLFD